MLPEYSVRYFDHLKRSGVALSFLIILQIVFCRQLKADPLAIGFPQSNERANFLLSSEPLPRMLNAAVTTSLAVSDPNSSRAQFTVSDASRISADYGTWSYRINADAEFSNGDPIAANDVLFSLRRCAALGALPGFVDTAVETSAPEGETWVEIHTTQHDALAAKAFANAIDRCAILQNRTSLIFGDELGVGSNVISGGPYVISAFSAGRKYILTRVRHGSRDRSGADGLELRTFASTDQALTALQVGTIIAFVAADSAVIDRASHDETITVEQCSGYSIVRRHSAVMPCIEKLSVVDIADD